MSTNTKVKFECENGHIFEPSNYGVSECPICQSKKFWPVDDDDCGRWKPWMTVALLATLSLAGAGIAWWLWPSEAPIYLVIEEKSSNSDPCELQLNVYQGETVDPSTSKRLSPQLFWYAKGAGNVGPKRSFCWSEGGTAMFSAELKAPGTYTWLNEDNTAQDPYSVGNLGSTSLGACDCYGTPPPPPDSCCGYAADNTAFRILDARDTCINDELHYLLSFDREPCIECNQKWFVRGSESEPWIEGSLVNVSGQQALGIWATYGETFDQNPPVEWIENGSLVDASICEPQAPITAGVSEEDIKRDLEVRLNDLTTSKLSEGVERYRIPGIGRVRINPVNIRVIVDGTPTGYRLLQNDILMLDLTIRVENIEFSNNEGNIDVTSIQVSTK